MVSERLDVRLDPERRRRLNAIAKERGAPVSEVMRQMIDDAYRDIDHAIRMRAVDTLATLNVEDVPDPDELNRQLDTVFNNPNLP